jgi:hypothetical protein
MQMKTYLKIGLFALAIFHLSGCSMSQLTVRASMPMIEGGVTAMNQESDLELARLAIPGNISLIEGMLINDPGNEQLRIYAAQAYYGYAFGFLEDVDPPRAAELYLRGFKHAQAALLNHGLSQVHLDGELEALKAQLNSLNKSAVPALFWSASCWAKAIDINRDQAASLAQLPRAVMLMQKTLELDEHYYMSGPHIFFGAYYGSKSPMLGGNFELSEAHFSKANQANDNKLLLVNLLKAQYLERQRYDRQAFHDLLTAIIEAPDSLYPEQQLINQISKEKARRLLEKEEQWF